MADLIEILRMHELLELFQNVVALSGIEALFTLLKTLELEEQMQELLKSRTSINIDVQNSLKRALAFCEFVHRSKVNRVAPRYVVLLSQDFAVSGQDISHVLLEKALKS